MSNLETWTNISQSRHAIKRMGAHGVLKTEVIRGQSKFHISEEDRRLNMEMAANPRLDPFSNGQFTPVRLLDGTEDAQEIASNPNLISEDEMAKLIKGNVKTLEARLKEIENPVVIDRLLAIAEESDTTVGRLKAIKTRQTELRPDAAKPVEIVQHG